MISGVHSILLVLSVSNNLLEDLFSFLEYVKFKVDKLELDTSINTNSF